MAQCDARLDGRGVNDKSDVSSPSSLLVCFPLWKDCNTVCYNTTVRVRVRLTNTLLVSLCGCCRLEESCINDPSKKVETRDCRMCLSHILKMFSLKCAAQGRSGMVC